MSGVHIFLVLVLACAVNSESVVPCKWYGLLFEEKERIEDAFEIISWENQSLFVNVSHKMGQDDFQACGNGEDLRPSPSPLVDLRLERIGNPVKNPVYVSPLKLSLLDPNTRGMMYLKLMEPTGTGFCLMVNITDDIKPWDFLGCYWGYGFFNAAGTIQDLTLHVSVNQMYSLFHFKVPNWKQFQYRTINVSEFEKCVLEPFVYVDITQVPSTKVTVATRTCNATSAKFTITKKDKETGQVLWNKTYTRDPEIPFTFEDHEGGSQYLYVAAVAADDDFPKVIIFLSVGLLLVILLIPVIIYLRMKKPKIKFIYSRDPRHVHYRRSMEGILKMFESIQSIQVVHSELEEEEGDRYPMDCDITLLPTSKQPEPNADFIAIVPMPDEEESVVVQNTMKKYEKKKIILLRLPLETTIGHMPRNKGKSKWKQPVACFQLMDDLTAFLKYTTGFGCFPYMNCRPISWLSLPMMPIISDSYFDVRGISNDVLKINFDVGYVASDCPDTIVVHGDLSSPHVNKALVDLDQLDL